MVMESNDGIGSIWIVLYSFPNSVSIKTEWRDFAEVIPIETPYPCKLGNRIGYNGRLEEYPGGILFTRFL
jgi:hypothetical protein